MVYKKQPNNTVLCGMYAIYNAMVWGGVRAKLSDYTVDLWSKLKTDKNGICGVYLHPVITRIFDAYRIKFPTLAEINSLLNRNQSIILRYKWGIDGSWGTHYCLLYRTKKSIIAVNPHRNRLGERLVERRVSSKELEMMLTRSKVGNNQYPWAWLIKR